MRVDRLAKWFFGRFIDFLGIFTNMEISIRNHVYPPRWWYEPPIINTDIVKRRRICG
jgi:hypothetical protein